MRKTLVLFIFLFSLSALNASELKQDSTKFYLKEPLFNSINISTNIKIENCRDENYHSPDKYFSLADTVDSGNLFFAFFQYRNTDQIEYTDFNKALIFKDNILINKKELYNETIILVSSNGKYFGTKGLSIINGTEYTQYNSYGEKQYSKTQYFSSIRTISNLLNNGSSIFLIKKDNTYTLNVIDSLGVEISSKHLNIYLRGSEQYSIHNESGLKAILITSQDPYDPIFSSNNSRIYFYDNDLSLDMNGYVEIDDPLLKHQ